MTSGLGSRVLVFILGGYLLCGSLPGVEIVRDGGGEAEIVLVDGALPQVVLAAAELGDHIEAISSVRLPVVSAPTGERYPIFVGPSEYTARLGVDVGSLEGEGYRVVVTDGYTALLGHDEIFPFYPRGFDELSKREVLLREWQEFAGEEWDFPFLNFYDPRNFNPGYGFSLFDPSGTLFAVYELLEQLGVRWYMPVHDFGTIIPSQSTIRLSLQDEVFEPVFGRRYLRFGWGRNNDLFLWSKRLRLGLTELIWNCHGTSRVTRFLQDKHPEYLAVVDGIVQNQTSFGSPGVSRLAPPLRDAMIRYANAFLDWFPETPHVSAAPNDGYVRMDDRDVEAGWLRSERGDRGRFSDYVWTFINEVAAGVAERHPDKIVMGLAYSGYREPPHDIDVMEPNVGVTFCQTRADFYDPERKARIFAEREQWWPMLPSGEFLVWEYYLWHRKGRQLWGVPVIFWGEIQDDLRALQGKSKGEYVEAWTLQGNDIWGINHMTVYLTARLYWDPELEREALLDEYYTLFYGPAAAQMRQFFEFAESVWMRPESRNVLGGDGFLRAEDVDRYFAILGQAQSMVEPGSDYARRIALIAEEIEPMNELFAFQRYRDLAAAARQAGNHEAAAGYLQRAVAAANDNRSRADTAFELGNLYRDQLGDTAKALEFYQLAMDTHIRGAGSAVRSHARMAAVEVLRRNQRFAEAIVLLDDYDTRHAFWKIAELRARARIAVDMGDPAAARRYLEQGLDVEGAASQQLEALRSDLGALPPGH